MQHLRVNIEGSKPTTIDDGAPSPDEMVVAYNIPRHRQAESRRTYAQHTLDLTKLHRSASRSTTQGTSDAIRRLGRSRPGDHGATSNVCRLISRGRARVIIDGAGQTGAMQIVDALRRREPRYSLARQIIAQALDDSLRCGSEAANDARDEAHGRATWLSLVFEDPDCDPDDQFDVDILTQMFAGDGICIREVSNMMMLVVDLVEREGPAYPPEGAVEPLGGALASLLRLDALDDQLSNQAAIEAEIRRQLSAVKPTATPPLHAVEPQQISLF